MKWILLYTAIVFEVAGTTALKLSTGLERPGVLAIALALYAISFVLLSLCLKNIPVGVAYAIWSGVGTLLVAMIGILWFRDALSAAKMIFIGLIVIGAVGLNLVGDR